MLQSLHKIKLIIVNNLIINNDKKSLSLKKISTTVLVFNNNQKVDYKNQNMRKNFTKEKYIRYKLNNYIIDFLLQIMVYIIAFKKASEKDGEWIN